MEFDNVINKLLEETTKRVLRFQVAKLGIQANNCSCHKQEEDIANSSLILIFSYNESISRINGYVR